MPTQSKRSTSHKSAPKKAAATKSSGARKTKTAKSKTTFDHEEIQAWAESHGATPSVVKSTHGKGKKGSGGGLLRLDFPGFSGEGSLEPIEWEEFFQIFDDNNLALVYSPDSNFNKLVSRE